MSYVCDCCTGRIVKEQGQAAAAATASSTNAATNDHMSGDAWSCNITTFSMCVCVGMLCSVWHCMDCW